MLSWASASASASAGPPWSALMMIRSAATSPSLRARLKSSRLVPFSLRRFWASRSSRCRFWAISRASSASVTTAKVSPAAGTPSKPRICTGMRRAGLLHRLAPLVVQRANAAGELAADEVVAAAQGAPLDQDGGQRALARIERGLEHGAVALAVRIGLEVEDLGLEQDLLQQAVDAGALLGRDLGREHVAAELLEHHVVLQQVLLDLRHVGASGRSILLIATIIGTPAFLAWLMASTVCGMTWSSAATTSTTMSVTWAPRARMAVKAWWPGVSRKVIALSPGRSTW